MGPAIAKDNVADTIDKILQVYLDQREADEQFQETYLRVGMEPFKAKVYAADTRKQPEMKAVAGY